MILDSKSLCKNVVDHIENQTALETSYKSNQNTSKHSFKVKP
jgi:hypothetical protein